MVQVVGNNSYFIKEPRKLFGARIRRSLARDVHVANGLLVYSLATLGVAVSYNDDYLKQVVPQARVRNALVLATGALYALTVFDVLRRRYQRGSALMADEINEDMAISRV